LDSIVKTLLRRIGGGAMAVHAPHHQKIRDD